MNLEIATPEAQERFGAALAKVLAPPALVRLEGDLGVGKTTLVRGLIRALGHPGPVKSPSYTLLEPYHFEDLDLFHLDLYRLADPEELEYLGLRDLLTPRALTLVEWPERGGDRLPPADLSLRLEYRGQGRGLQLSGPRAREILDALESLLADISGIQF